MGARKIAAVLVAAVIFGPMPSANAQIDAGNPPTVRGPLSTRDNLQGCRRRTERSGGRVLAYFKVCFGYYLFDPSQEDNPSRDYGAFWAQATVLPRGGWCARNARLDLHLPASGTHAKTPAYGTSRTPPRARTLTARLEVDAQGHSSALGVLRKRFTIFPNSYNVVRIHRGRTHSSQWRGNEDRKLAFVSGIELSWNPGSMLPVINPVVGARLRKTGNC